MGVGERNGGCMGTGFFWGYENVLELGVGGSCITL